MATRAEPNGITLIDGFRGSRQCVLPSGEVPNRIRDRRFIDSSMPHTTHKTISSKATTDKWPAMEDITESLHRFDLIVYLAISDLRSRYRRTVLGPFWFTLNTLVASVGLGLLWSELLNIDRVTFMPSITVGMIVWSFISGIIVDSTTLYSTQSTVIRNINLPLSIWPAQLVSRHLINLAHTAPVFLVLAYALRFPLTKIAWLALPGLLLVSLNMLWLSLLLGMLGARFRDLGHLVVSLMPLIMLVSPVFYRPNFLPFSENIMWLNPFSHFIELVRYPLLGSPPPLFVVKTNLLLFAIGTILTLWIFNRKHHRISFWL